MLREITPENNIAAGSGGFPSPNVSHVAKINKQTNKQTDEQKLAQTCPPAFGRAGAYTYMEL